MSDYKNQDASSVAKQYYTEYGEYVNATRAFPSIYDGLKLVHRRIIYIANQLPEKLMKTAELAGKVMQLNPHGDCSGSIVSLATPVNKVPLMVTKGNFGGAIYSAASSRYTECYLSPLARMMYCSYVDYANFIEGEIDHDEPEALPCLIPYALINGYEGMGVGLSAKILPLNVMDLIEYYKDIIQYGHSDKLVKPDIGPVVLDMDDEDIKSYVNDHKSYIRSYSIVTQESDSVVVVSGLGNRLSINRLLNRLDDLISTDKVDFRNESSIQERYVFEIMDKSITPADLKLRLESATISNDTYRRIMIDGGVACACSLEYVAKKSSALLISAVNKWIDSKIESMRKKIAYQSALVLAKTKGAFKDISEISHEEFISRLVNLGISEELAMEVASRPISPSRLTKSPSAEDENLKKLSDELNYYETLDRTKYILDQYDKLKELIQPIYDSKPHSITKSSLLVNPKVIVKNNNLEVGNPRGGYKFSSYVFVVNDEGKVIRLSVSSSSKTIIDLSEYGNILGLTTDLYPKLVITVKDAKGYIRAIGYECSNYKYDKQILRLNDGDKIIKVYGYTSESAPSYFNDIVKSKISKAIYVEELNK